MQFMYSYRRYIRSVRHHLTPETGECWLILSDLAELLGLRTREALLGMIEAGGLEVAGRTETPAVHRRGRRRQEGVEGAKRKE